MCNTISQSPLIFGNGIPDFLPMWYIALEQYVYLLFYSKIFHAIHITVISSQRLKRLYNPTFDIPIRWFIFDNVSIALQIDNDVITVKVFEKLYQSLIIPDVFQREKERSQN